VEAYKIDSDGELHFINKQPSNGADPCHIDVSHDGKFTAIATYGGGTISLYGINPDGSLSSADITIKFEGTGFNSSRQKTPHAHSVLFSPGNRQLFSADLGTDRLNIFDIKNKKLEYAGQSHVNLAPGAGPRHFTFHPDSKTIFVINELNSTITVLKKTARKWQEQQTVSTLPKGFSGDNYCADIHVSADGKYLYGSNRGHNSIAVYKVDAKTKKLEWVTSVSTHGTWPRNFILTSDGKFLLAANQKSNNITVFSINPENGIPKFTGNEVIIPAPVCLVF
jgi:6-phosphogluconolactonase